MECKEELLKITRLYQELQATCRALGLLKDDEIVEALHLDFRIRGYVATLSHVTKQSRHLLFIYERSAIHGIRQK